MGRRRNTEEDFWRRVDDPDENGCRRWLGPLKEGTGYGQFSMAGRSGNTHAWAFRFVKGEPEHQVNHACGNPWCCNPDHLYDGTQSENIKDAVRHGTHPEARKTHCPAGHEYTDDNLVKQNGRKCRTCHNQRQRERWARKMQDPEFREAERQRRKARP